MVNGGDYAYVIRPDEPPSAAPGAQQATAAPTGSAQAGPVRAITSGAAFTDGPSAVPVASVPAASVPESAAPAVTQSDAASQESQPTSPGPVTPGGRTRPEAVPEVDPALAYGPDDPAYGPPGPDWYKREAERTPGVKDAEPDSAEDETPAARGPFEPLRASDREAAASADHQPGDEAAFGDPGVDPLASETSSYDDEISKLLGLGEPADPEEDVLGQIRGLYDNAETVSEASLDLHFDQLLERQRQLIAEYFEEAGGLSLADAAAAAETAESGGTQDPGTAESAVPFGFDTAESLASLRGELRGAQ